MLRAARHHLLGQDIRSRTRAINKAVGIAAQLSACLNHEPDAPFSRNLAGLYTYVIRLLIDANLKQIEAPLAEAESLMSTLADAWNACAPAVPERIYPNNDLVLQHASASDSSAGL